MAQIDFQVIRPRWVRFCGAQPPSLMDRLFGQLDRAIADFSKAIEINPRYAEVYIRRGIVYRIKGDSDNAIVDYTRAAATPLRPQARLIEP